MNDIEWVKYSNLTLTFKDGVRAKVDKERIHAYFNVLDTILELDSDAKNIDMNCEYSDVELFLDYVYRGFPKQDSPEGKFLFLPKNLKVADQYGFLKSELENIFLYYIPEKILDREIIHQLIEMANTLQINLNIKKLKHVKNLIINIIYLIFTESNIYGQLSDTYSGVVKSALRKYITYKFGSRRLFSRGTDHLVAWPSGSYVFQENEYVEYTHITSGSILLDSEVYTVDQIEDSINKVKYFFGKVDISCNESDFFNFSRSRYLQFF